MKKIDLPGKLEHLFLCSFYPILFFALFGILKLVDGLYFQDFPLLIRAVFFFAGVFSGAALGYVSATVIFDHYSPRPGRIMEEFFDEKHE